MGGMLAVRFARTYPERTAVRSLGQYPQLGRAAARDLPGARLVELENVGHIPHLEGPEAFHLSALLAFLGP
jgi:pimeloyl-ACP methyl ester carboxylesterase